MWQDKGNYRIDFKDATTADEFSAVQPRLQALVMAAASWMYFTYGVNLVVTDLMRDDLKSVHGHGNGADFRTSNLTEEQGDGLVEFLKWQFPYYLGSAPIKMKYSVRDEREKGSSAGWTGAHIHAQVNWREA